MRENQKINFAVDPTASRNNILNLETNGDVSAMTLPAINSGEALNSAKQAAPE